MWRIRLYDYNSSLLVWKYEGKISSWLRNQVVVPPGFEAVVKLINGGLIPVYESDDFKKISDIFFVRIRTEKFIVLNSTELVRRVAGLGNEIEISYFMELINQSSDLSQIIRWVGE